MSYSDPAFDHSPRGLLSQRMRLVYPFRIPRERLTQVRTVLIQSGTWQGVDLDEEFRKEMLEGASRFVFGALRDQPARYYFQHRKSFARNVRDGRRGRTGPDESYGPLYGGFLNGHHGIKWLLHHVRPETKPRSGESERPDVSFFHIDADRGMELFLNPFGVGVATVTIVRDLPYDARWTDLLSFVYHLSHIKYRCPLLWRVDAEEELVQLDRVTDTDVVAAIKSQRASACRSCSSALDAAGTRNTPFTIPELFEESLKSLGVGLIEGTQGQLMVYSVVEFDHATQFSDTRRFQAPICAMAQLEEPSHPPTTRDQQIVETLALTTKHLTAATNMGVVHFVARQYPAGEQSDYDESRASRILVKYFASTLAAYFQFLGVQAYTQQAIVALESTEVASKKLARESELGCNREDEIIRLSAEVTRFAAAANMALVNRRESHNRYYQSLQRAFHVSEAIVWLQGTLRDMGLAREARMQLEQQVLLGTAQEELHESESRLGNLELFVVLVYVVEMAHIFGELTMAKHSYSMWVALAGLFTTLLVTLPLVKRWPDWLYEKMPADPELLEKEQHGQRHRRWAAVAAVGVVIYLLALLVPYAFPRFRAEEERHRDELVKPASKPDAAIKPAQTAPAKSPASAPGQLVPGADPVDKPGFQEPYKTPRAPSTKSFIIPNK